MKTIIKRHATESLLEKYGYDVSGLTDEDVLYLESDDYDRILCESYVTTWDEIGDSCDDDSLIIVEKRKYYDRDVRCDYNSTKFYLFEEEEGEF